jgi:hypothetical protein
MWPNNPEFSVLVVDEQMISLAAEALIAPVNIKQKNNSKTWPARLFIIFLLY